jgi:hypothetical protein
MISKRFSVIRERNKIMNRSIIPPFDPNAPRPVHAPMVYVTEPLQWEYKILVRNLEEEKPLDEAELKALGKEGWEMAGVAQYSSRLYFYFKRVANR